MPDNIKIKELQKKIQDLEKENKQLKEKQSKDFKELNLIRALVQNLQMGVIIETDDRKIISVNQAFCAIFGIPDPKMLSNMDCSQAAEGASKQFLYPDKFLNDITPILIKKQVVLNEELPLKDGRILERDFIPVLKEDKMLGNMWIYRDITYRKKAEQELRENTTKLEAFFSQSLIGFFFMMLDEPIDWKNAQNKNELLDYAFKHQKITKINKAMLDQYIAKEKDFLNLTPANFFEHNIEYGKKIWKQLFDDGHLRVETNEKRFDGKDLFVEGDYICFYDSKGRITGHFGVQQDITENIKARKALEESEKKFRTFVDNSTDAIRLIDENQNVIFVNKAHKQLTGYDESEILGKNLIDVLTKMIPEQYRNNQNKTVLSNSLKEMLQNPEYPLLVKPHERAIQTKKGKIIQIQESVFRIVTEKGIRLGSILRDITELKEKENELTEINLTKDKLYSIIAHDLRSPFNGILGFSQLALEQLADKDYEDVEESLGLVFQSAKLSFDLLNNLLQWSRIQTGRITFKPYKINLLKIVHGIYRLLKANINEKKINFIKNIDCHLQVFADSFMLETIIRNLLSNAIKYTRKGGEIIIHAYKKNNDTVISIKDNGVGMKAEHIDKLFKLENKISTKGTNNEIGTGLGLIMCKEFIEKHNGTITVKSEFNIGSEFEFTIPDDLN